MVDIAWLPACLDGWLVLVVTVSCIVLCRLVSCYLNFYDVLLFRFDPQHFRQQTREE